MAAKRRRGANKSTFVSVEGAEFFKVFLPNLSSHQLMIPPDFTKNFRKTMKEKIILKNNDGKTWYVDVKETLNGIFLEDGWQSFVDYHGLKVGEFLVFWYVGSFSFVVQIFGTNGCKKKTLGPKNIATHVKSEEETDIETKPKQTCRKRAPPRSDDHSSSVDRRSKQTCDQSENWEINETTKQRNVWRRGACITRKNPCFSIVLTKTHIKMGNMNVPVEFWRAHMRKSKRSREVTLWVENDAWDVGVVNYGNKILFQKGCPKFLKDNSHKLGTSCTFQLIDTNHLSFKVTFPS